MAKHSKQSGAGDVKKGQERQELEERIRFEELLCDLSATFVNLSADAVDKEIEHGLKLVVKFLGADRGILLQFSEDGKTLNITHSYIAPGVKPLPFTSIGPDERLLWYEQTLQNEEMVALENLPDDLPEEAIAERQFCIEQGTKSYISIPLSIGKASPKGVIGFDYLQRRQTWPMQCIQRVQFVGHIFASILRRKRTENELARAFAEIKNLKERLEAENRYLNGEIKVRLLKEDERPVKSLSTIQIRKLLLASGPFPTLRMRILLALGTGLRRGDIESMRVSDIDSERSYVTTKSKKTRKSMGSRPVPVPIMAELKKYVSGLNPKQERIFNRRFNQRRWDKIREKLGLSDFKFHDLRKTFGSVLAQNGVSTAVTQKLLEHSSPDLTNKVYTNVDPVLRHAVDQIPAGDWL